MRPDVAREPIIGPESGPQPPFPLRVSGEVIRGFGRGSKELGIPTANIPIEGLTIGGHSELESGVYFGWAGLDFRSAGASPPTHGHGVPSVLEQTTAKVAGAVRKILGDGEGDDAGDSGWEGKGRVHPMVMSIGWNPYYKNEKRSVEVHIMHNFTRDFYGSHLNLVILGFIRPEYDYVTKDLLIEDIKTDVEVSGRSLSRPAWAEYRKDGYLLAQPEREGKGERAEGATTQAP